MKKSYSNINYQQALADWNSQDLCELDAEYNSLRTELTSLWEDVVQEIGDGKKYLLDLKFGVKLKEYFDSKSWFNLRLAADINFWRYMSVFVLPNVVLCRWGSKADDRYWQKPARIWLRSIWWYAYLGWSASAEKTVEILGAPVFNTDIILNTVERTGRKGTPVNVYKEILHTYAQIPASRVHGFSSSSDGNSDTLYRSVMRLNTAKIIVVEPELYEGGVKGYVNGLFADLGIDIEEREEDAVPPVYDDAQDDTLVDVPSIVVVDYASPYKINNWRGSVHLVVDMANKTLTSMGWTVGKNKQLSDAEKHIYIEFFSNINNLTMFFDERFAYNTPPCPTGYDLTITWGTRKKSISVGYPDVPFQHPFKNFQ